MFVLHLYEILSGSVMLENKQKFLKLKHSNLDQFWTFDCNYDSGANMYFIFEWCKNNGINAFSDFNVSPSLLPRWKLESKLLTVLPRLVFSLQYFSWNQGISRFGKSIQTALFNSKRSWCKPRHRVFYSKIKRNIQNMSPAIMHRIQTTKVLMSLQNCSKLYITFIEVLISSSTCCRNFTLKI